MELGYLRPGSAGNGQRIHGPDQVPGTLGELHAAAAVVHYTAGGIHATEGHMHMQVKLKRELRRLDTLSSVK